MADLVVSQCNLSRIEDSTGIFVLDIIIGGASYYMHLWTKRHNNNFNLRCHARVYLFFLVVGRAEE